MKPGPLIRRLFGRYERPISNAYRSLYIDLDALALQILSWKPRASRVLEVGCGEGAMTERLRSAYPDAELTAIDVSPRLGRLYRGSTEHTRFLQCEVRELAERAAGTYELVTLCDVLHHVPPPRRRALLEAIRRMLAPGGIFVFKDWESSFTPIHWMCHASDRWLTGDRVSYLSGERMREMLSEVFGEQALTGIARVGPRRNNLAIRVESGRA